IFFSIFLPLSSHIIHCYEEQSLFFKYRNDNAHLSCLHCPTINRILPCLMLDIPFISIFFMRAILEYIQGFPQKYTSLLFALFKMRALSNAILIDQFSNPLKKPFSAKRFIAHMPTLLPSW